jgi:hypothetical protein
VTCDLITMPVFQRKCTTTRTSEPFLNNFGQ